MWPFKRSPTYHQVLTRLKQVEDDLVALESKHERLRGRFYATRGDDSPPQPQSKADILRAHGFIPGRPPPTKAG